MHDLQAVARELGYRPEGRPRSVSGGCIHSAYLWGDCFIKCNARAYADHFAAEAAGLKAIAGTRTLRVPEVLGYGASEDIAWIALEALELVPRGNEERLGQQLAALHHRTSDRFGFSSDNYLGATPQPNSSESIWVDFFRQKRIEHLLRLLESNGMAVPEGGRFLERIPLLIPEKPPAAMIHGDLWGGNKSYLPEGTPVVFDPATYFGDAECDIAMTRLFGGFGPQFYEAYRHLHPAPAGESELHEIYNLYHLLNHALLFGASYLSQARGIMRRYL